MPLITLRPTRNMWNQVNTQHMHKGVSAMLSTRIQNIKPSATGVMAGHVTELKAAGVSLACFNIGEPDFPTPKKIVRACNEALAEGKTKYTPIGGILPLQEAICEKLNADNSLCYSPEQICITTGAKQAVYAAVQTLCDPGDEVIILTPCWVSYEEMVKLAGATPILIPTTDTFHPDPERIAAAVTGRTRMLILNSPNNPTGAVYSEEELSAIAELAEAHDFYMLSDEVYEKLVYDGAVHRSIASVSREAYARTITVNGFSKAYAMTGWRLGYAAGPSDVIRGIVSLQGHVTANATSFVQWAAITALKECSAEVETMRMEFARRREEMIRLMEQIPGLSCPKPEGAFYLMPDVSAYFGKQNGTSVIRSAGDLCEYLLDEARIAVVTGEAFEAPNCIRISYSASMEEIRSGMARAAQAFCALR